MGNIIIRPEKVPDNTEILIVDEVLIAIHY
jgi:hypothetical protein